MRRPFVPTRRAGGLPALALLLAACGPAVPAQTPAWLAEATASAAPPDVELELDGCEQTFPFAARGLWHEFDGEAYFVGVHGRPERARALLPPVEPAPRRSSCQAAVGRWGDEENPEDDYDGGHLIGSQLGGWGGRMNLVPQDLNLNRGNWLQIENALADCSALPEGSISFEAVASYPDEETLIPDTMTMFIENQDRGESFRAEFENFAQGPEGRALRLAAVAFLRALGCE